MKCPVCGNDTLDDAHYDYDICSECFWEYDPVQMQNPNLGGGANSHSLIDYRKMYCELKKKNPHFSCQNEADRELIVSLDHKPYQKQ